jgi:hypothetical protein
MMSARELELPKHNSKHNGQGETTIYKQPRSSIMSKAPRPHHQKYMRRRWCYQVLSDTKNKEGERWYEIRSEIQVGLKGKISQR